MSAWLRNLWSNQVAFLETIGLVGAKLRGLIAVFSALILTGKIDLGPYGWWGTIAALAASQFIAAGEKNDPSLAKRIEKVEEKL